MELERNDDALKIQRRYLLCEVSGSSEGVGGLFSPPSTSEWRRDILSKVRENTLTDQIK